MENLGREKLAGMDSSPFAPSLQNVLSCVLAAALVAPSLPKAQLAVVGIPDLASLCSHELALRLKWAGISGPLCGNAIVAGGRSGLLTAFLIGQPWCGEAADADINGFMASGATLAVMLRGAPMALALGADPRVTNLDARLFLPGEETASFPLQVFRLAHERAP